MIILLLPIFCILQFSAAVDLGSETETYEYQGQVSYSGGDTGGGNGYGNANADFACTEQCPAGLGANQPSICGRCGSCPSDYFNDGKLLECQACSKFCDVGTGTNGIGGSNCWISRDRICGPCASGTFNGNTGGVYGNQLLCQACRTQCSAGTGTSQPSCGPATDFTCDPCPWDHFNTGNQLRCQRCRQTCPRGTGLLTECTATADGVCGTMAGRRVMSMDAMGLCQAGIDWNDGSFLRCQVCTNVCAPGTGVNGVNGASCTPVANRICGECTAGTNFNAGDGLRCQVCSTTCPCGTGVNEGSNCTQSSNRVCNDCPEGTFNDGTGLVCQACARCGPGFGTLPGGQCTRAKNTLCEACPYGKFSAGNSSCIECRPTCPRGLGLNAECNTTADATCTACAAGTTFNDGTSLVCKGCTMVCEPGTGINNVGGAVCTLQKDRVCVKCPLGQQFNTGDNLDCTPCSTKCIQGTGTNGPLGSDCTLSSDRVCTACTPGTFNDGSVLQCTACSTACPAGTGTNTQGGAPCNPPIGDRVCAACGGGTFNDGSVLQCTACSTECSAGTGTDAPGGAPCNPPTSDRVCAACGGPPDDNPAGDRLTCVP